jgi:hypothetical protein
MEREEGREPVERGPRAGSGRRCYGRRMQIVFDTSATYGRAPTRYARALRYRKRRDYREHEHQDPLHMPSPSGVEHGTPASHAASVTSSRIGPAMPRSPSRSCHTSTPKGVRRPPGPGTLECTPAR